MTAFPEDAEQADLRNTVDWLLEASKRGTSSSKLFGGKLSDTQVEKLCAAVLPLNIDWLTPEQVANDSDVSIPSPQRAAWIAFYQVDNELNEELWPRTDLK